MSRVGFSLIELILVIFLISFISFLVIKIPENKKVYTFKDLRELLYPNGEFCLGKKAYVIKDGKKKEINFRYSSFEVYDLFFEKKEFKKCKFRYKIKNGIGDSLIVKEKKVYFFKPLWVKEFNSLEDVKIYISKLNELVDESLYTN